MASVSIRLLAHQMKEMAAPIYAVQTAAYRQEAVLLGVRAFPPLDRTVQDVTASSDVFFGAFDGEELLGVISLEQQSANEVLISSLTVAPSYQRRGVARALIVAVAGQTVCSKISVSTTTKNHPALALYKQLGFGERQRRSVGSEPLEIVELSAKRSNISVNADARERAFAEDRVNQQRRAGTRHLASRGRRLP